MQLQAQQMQAQVQQALRNRDNVENSINDIEGQANGVQEQLLQSIGGGNNDMS